MSLSTTRSMQVLDHAASSQTVSWTICQQPADGNEFSMGTSRLSPITMLAAMVYVKHQGNKYTIQHPSKCLCSNKTKHSVSPPPTIPVKLILSVIPSSKIRSDNFGTFRWGPSPVHGRPFWLAFSFAAEPSIDCIQYSFKMLDQNKIIGSGNLRLAIKWQR